MMRVWRSMAVKLPFARVLSSLLVAATVIAGSAVRAHEVQPAIADLEAVEGGVQLTIALALEAHLSGIDLDGLEDTNDAENSADYDALRALSAGEIAARAPQLVVRWSALPLLRAGGEALPLTLVSVSVDDVSNVELRRAATLVVRAETNAPSVSVAWPEGAGDMVLRQQGVDAPFTGYLSGGETSADILLAGGAPQTGWSAFVDYVPVGFDHILPKGLDHILFVLGLFFLSMRLGALLWQVTAFTAAHTITLALAALGVVNVPGSIVEPLIAASIVYVAVENILSSEMKPWRPALVFALGLLHGLGFASVLGDYGIPQAQFIPALLGFNLGVEIGQLTVIAIAFLTVGWFAKRVWYRRVIAVPASAVIALIGAYWVVERTLL